MPDNPRMNWLDEVKWDAQGLVPVIAQEIGTNDVLMFAWMDREALRRTAELGRAVGLGGRARRSGSAAERARSAVQRRIKNALGRIDEADPELGAALARRIRTGNFCVYRDL